MLKKHSKRSVWFRTAALSLAGLILLGLLVWKADPARVALVLRNAEPKWVGMMLIALIAATLLGAINSYLVSVAGSGLSFWSFLGAYWCAWAFGQVIPGQIGDLIGLSLFLRRRGLALPAVVGRLSVDKLISLFCLLALSGGLIFIYDNPLARVAGLSGACAAVFLLVAYRFSLRWRLVSNKGDGLRGHLMHALNEAHIIVRTRPAIVAVNLTLTFLKLVMIGLCYWATFRALQVSTASFMNVTVIANSAGLIAYIPVSANGVGTVEAGGVYLFGLLGVLAPVVLAAYVTMRIANFALAFLGVALVVVFSAKAVHKNYGRS